MSGDRAEIQQRLEESIIKDDESLLQDRKVVAFSHRVKNIGMQLSRSDAQLFNQFITAALGE